MDLGLGHWNLGGFEVLGFEGLAAVGLRGSRLTAVSAPIPRDVALDKKQAYYPPTVHSQNPNRKSLNLTLIMRSLG